MTYALLAVVVASATMAAPASAAFASTSTTTPAVTTTTVKGPTTTTTTAPVAGTTTTAAPPTTVPGPPPTTVPSGPPTTLVSPTDLAALLNGLNADLAKLSAIQAFAQAKAAAAAGPVKPGSTAVGAQGPPAVAVAAVDPAMVGAAAAELKASAVRDSAEFAVASSRRRLHELAVAYYLHADVAGGSGVVDPASGTAADRSVMLALLLSQERHNFDGGRRALADAKKAQSGAKAHADQLVAARAAAIEAAARKAALDATTTTTTTSTTAVTVPGTPAPAPAPTIRGVPAYHTSGLTILGPAVMSGDELKGWYGSTGHQPSLTVPLATLTALYQTTGVTYGVRDDIAFAQAVIETGYFGFPGGGMVRTADNNFAGIGACDSCHNGNGFPSAASGVAAQLQLLHNYASPVPMPGPLGLSVGPTGCCPTWMSLTGVWATASFYGYAILTLYKRMLDWALPRRAGGVGL